MNDINIGPVIVTEVYRSKGEDDPFGGHYPESHGFHTIEPDDRGNWNIQPFVTYDEYLNARFDPEGDGRVPGSPCYKEAGRDLFDPEKRTVKVQELADQGYAIYTLDQVPEAFQRFVIHNQCPMEWQGRMDQGVQELIERVRIWVKGDFSEVSR